VKDQALCTNFSAYNEKQFCVLKNYWKRLQNGVRQKSSKAVPQLLYPIYEFSRPERRRVLVRFRRGPQQSPVLRLLG
jgi:hypothetical protein